MYPRVFCAFLLLASPAMALDVFEDYLITVENTPPRSEVINVYGDATLTLDTETSGAFSMGNIWLRDSASLVLNSGWIDGDVNVVGENSFVMNGGIISGFTGVRGHEGSRAIVELVGGEIRTSSVALHLGDHRVYIRNTTSTRIVRVGGNGNVFVEAFAEDPRYAFYDSQNVSLSMGNGTSFRVPRDKWLLHATDQRVSADLDGNGVVDLADLNEVRNNFGVSRPVDMLGDTLPYDGVIDLTDLNLVRNTFGASTPVPEPSTFIITLTLLTLAAWRWSPLSPFRRLCPRLAG